MYKIICLSNIFNFDVTLFINIQLLGGWNTFNYEENILISHSDYVLVLKTICISFVFKLMSSLSLFLLLIFVNLL